MNEQNLDYLSRQIKFTGFGESHEKDLKDKMESGIADFVLFHNQEFGQDTAAATLHFRKSENLDLYFFNRFELVVTGNLHTGAVKQTFYIHPKEDPISLKEGYNLLRGRSIHKDYQPKVGEKYKAWLQLDFKDANKNGQYKILQFHPNYGFDLDATIHKHPILELNNTEEKKRLLESLERGNRQQVSYGEPGNEQKVFIEASPQFKTINIYDDSMRRVMAGNLQQISSQAATQKPALPETVISHSPAKKESTENPTIKKGKEMSPKQKGQKMPG
jgi:hypothetical protein